jgi:hypothetical protein
MDCENDRQLGLNVWVTQHTNIAITRIIFMFGQGAAVSAEKRAIELAFHSSSWSCRRIMVTG